MTEMTQIQGREIKRSLNIGGVEYHLRRDATDPTGNFAHERVHWINAGCDAIAGVHVCWIRGVVPPSSGTLEVPVDVFYIGFHPQKINMSPQTLTFNDLNRMHVYASDARGFAHEFTQAFLGIDAQAVDEREPISPHPSDIEIPEKMHADA